MSIFSRTIATDTDPHADEQADAKLAAIALNAIMDGVVVVDAQGVVIMINPAARVMTGYTNAEDAVGLHYTSVLNFEDENGQTCTEGNGLVQAFNTNTPFKSRKYFLVNQGIDKRLAIAVNLMPANTSDNERIITFRDITAEVETENKQMEFIATASHEMRTPVASIEGYLGLALNPQTATIDERAQKYLAEAHRASQHLGQLFRDLLDVTKLEDQAVKVNLEPVELRTVTAEIINSYQNVQLTEKHLQLVFENEVATDNARIEQLLYSVVDMQLWRAVIENLIGNAVKYTPENGKITIRMRGEPNQVITCVQDTGIGIPAHDLQHIFQKFYRVDNRDTRTIGGSGLGLYLAKQQVEAMRGKIWATSMIKEGSSFYIALPRLSNVEYERLHLAQTSSNNSTNNVGGQNG